MPQGSVHQYGEDPLPQAVRMNRSDHKRSISWPSL